MEKDFSLPAEGFVRPAQIAHALGMSTGTLYNRINAGVFPPLIKDGRMSRWPVGVLRKIIEDQGGTMLDAHRVNGQGSQPMPAS